MHEIRAYALAAVLLVLAPASQAGLPPQKWIDRDVRLTPSDRVVPHEIAEAPCCKNAWEHWDRYGTLWGWEPVNELSPTNPKQHGNWELRLAWAAQRAVKAQ